MGKENIPLVPEEGDPADADKKAKGSMHISSEEAWKMREKFIAEDEASKDPSAKGSMDISAEESWKMREEFIAKKVEKKKIDMDFLNRAVSEVEKLDNADNVLLAIFDEKGMRDLDLYTEKEAHEFVKDFHTIAEIADRLARIFKEKRDEINNTPLEDITITF